MSSRWFRSFTDTLSRNPRSSGTRSRRSKGAKRRVPLLLEKFEDRVVPSLTSVFELDGNPNLDATASPPHEWSQVYNDVTQGTHTSATGSLQFTHNANIGTSQDISYSSQSKDNADINTWGWNLGKPNSKSEIGDGFAAVYPDTNAHTLLYVGADRVDTSSASDTLGVWFLHTPIALSDPNASSGAFVVKGSNFVTSATIPTGGGGTGYKYGDILTLVGGQFTTQAKLKVTSIGTGGAVTGLSVMTAGAYSVVPLNGTFTTSGATGKGCAPTLAWSGTAAHHTVGDVLFAANFSSTVSYVAYQWNGTTIPATGTTLTSTQGIAIANATPISNMPWKYVNNSGGSSCPINDFLEEGVDMNELFGASLPDFSSFVIETRTSNSSTATLQSFILGNVSTKPNVAVSKSVDASPVYAENQVGYTVTVKNAGVGDLSGVTLNDPLPPGPGPAGGPYTASNINWVIDTTQPNAADFQITTNPITGIQTLTFNPAVFNGNMAFDASLSVHIIGYATFLDIGTLTNTATVNATSDDNPTDNTVNAYIEVRDNAPVAINDTYGVAPNTSTTISAPTVRANDTDPDIAYGDSITVVSVTGNSSTATVATSGTTVTTAHGSVTIYPDGHFTYKPAANYTGPDSFSYQDKDSLGTLSNTATVSINVSAAVLPTATMPAAQSAMEGASQPFNLGNFKSPLVGMFTVDVNWGDGSAHTTFTMTTSTANTSTTITQQSHTYVEEGSETITVIVTDPNTVSASATSAVTVADALLTGSSGASYSGTVFGSASLTNATFTDANPGDNSADMAATITWGDGGSTWSGTVSYSSGIYTVTGSHTYVNAGTYSISILVNDEGGSSTIITGTANVAKANVTITVTPYSVTYDGNPHTATGMAMGGTGVDLSSLLVLSGTTHINAGDYPSDPWSFTGNSNYNSMSGTVHDIISKANATIVVTPYGVTYDGAAHAATGTAAGVGAVILSGLNLSGTTHTNAGTFNGDSWTFTDVTGNYNNAGGTVNDSIAKANAVIAVTGYSVTYDGNPHTATGTAKGLGGVSLSGLDLSGTTHTNAGTYNGDPWAFTDVTGNYNNASGTVNDSIARANASILVTPYSLTYDGNSHTATGTATGAGGVSLSGLDLSGTTQTNAGTYTGTWTFTDSTGNYNSVSGTVNDSIAKANAIISVMGYSVPYDGNAHTATGSATGVGGVSLSGLNLSGTTHTIAGSYPADSWTFTDATGNYNNANGTVADLIDAPPVVYVGGNTMLDPGDLWSRLHKNFTDSDSTSWTGTVNYGDGTGTQALTLYNTVPGVGGNVDLSHTWTTPGTFTVTVAITDNSGAVGKGSFTVTINTPQFVIGGPVTVNPSTDVLTQQELQPIVAAAINEWRAAGLNAAALNVLSHTPVQIVGLTGAMVGGTNPAGIQIDPTAEGHGWFVDALHSPTESRVDLLTVVAHEMGNVLGIPEDNGNDLMGKWLAAGVRRLPTAAIVASAGLEQADPAGNQGLDAAVLAVLFAEQTQVAALPSADLDGQHATGAADTLSESALASANLNSSAALTASARARIPANVPGLQLEQALLDQLASNLLS